MNGPLRDARLYDTRRPWLSHTDTRVALGSAPRHSNWPDAACAYCWPALVQSTHHDPLGQPCCPMCAGNANRRAM